MPTGRDIKRLAGLNASTRTDEEKRAIKERVYNEYYNSSPSAFSLDSIKNAFTKPITASIRDKAYDYIDHTSYSPEQEYSIENEFIKKYSPIKEDGTRDNSIGLGSEWEKYNELSPKSKAKLMVSGWKNEKDFNDSWDKSTTNSVWDAVSTADKWLSRLNPLSSGYAVLQDLISTSLNDKDLATKIAKAKEMRAKNPNAKIDFDSSEIDFSTISAFEEGHKEFEKRRNNNILTKLYNEDAEKRTFDLGNEVQEAYYNSGLLNMSDDDVRKAFYQVIQPNSYIDESGQYNRGIPEYAAHIVSGEMKDFTIDDMRKVLAKKAVYEQNMSPEMAATALNNEAKKYIKDHQSTARRLSLFANDVAIASMSYTADKVNSIYNTGLAVADMFDKPVVWVDDRGQVLDLNKVALQKDNQGKVFYIDTDGSIHAAHQTEVDRTTLHNMGKEFDGSDSKEGVFRLNPQYWTKAEMYGTLDAQEQKQYEKIGASPHTVVWDPNEDSNLWYESFKMMSFGIADQALQLLPYGIGKTGKLLSSASKLGRVGSAIGGALTYTGEALANPKFQGILGAGGIAYAYQRGAFNETLQQNLANAEEMVLNDSKNEVLSAYAQEGEYRDSINSKINSRVEDLKKEYISKLPEDSSITDEGALNKHLHAIAENQILSDEVQKQVNKNKASDRYSKLVDTAIDNTGKAALTVFFPEAIKYGLVNTLGYRKFLYTNPSGVTRKVSSTLKGLREVTTESGKQRLATEASRFATRNQKLKQFGKIAGSQIWGGAWTNGTDDMMVDAAERINLDSYDRYLNAYHNGEALTETYGFADGLYSYLLGLGNSLGQETTLNAAMVGGLGSVVSATPHTVNILSMFTKEGRKAFKDAYTKRNVYETVDGIKTLKRDEKGNPITEDVGWRENWRDRLGFFIQNGLLNTYYGAKLNENDLQHHADYLNKILDDEEDFKVIEDLVASDLANENADGIADEKTMRFIQAINSIRALNQLGNSKNDPATLSSVVQNAKEKIKQIADAGIEGTLDQIDSQTISDYLTEYYAHRPDVDASEENNIRALEEISKNAQRLQDAAEAYDAAENDLQKIEREEGISIDSTVRHKLKMDKALYGHWRERVKTMKEEIGLPGDAAIASSDTYILSVLGSLDNAKAYQKVMDRQISELLKNRTELEKEIKTKEDAVEGAKKVLANASSDAEKYEAQHAVEEAQAELEDKKQELKYITDIRNESINRAVELDKLIKTQENLDEEVPILSADTIFHLDDISRAAMLDESNEWRYSDSQKKEINKLKNQLRIKDTGSLQKIQDIARLSQRIAATEDSFSRIIDNPEAAAVRFENQRQMTINEAHTLFYQRAAEKAAAIISDFDNGVKTKEDVTPEQRQQVVFQMLKKLNPTLLDIIDEDELLPEYTKQVSDAREWGKIVADIDAVINETDGDNAWKDNVSRAIATIVDNANDRDGIMQNLEQAIDDMEGSQAAQDFEKVLNGLEQLGYQRDATIVEDRKQRKEREEAERKKKEEAEEDAKIAAAEAQAKAQEAANAQQAQEVKSDGSNLQNPWEVAPIDQGEGTAEQKGELSEAIDLTKGESVDEWVVPSNLKITKSIANDGFGESYTEGVSDETVDEFEQPKLKATADYLNGKMTDREYLEAIGYATESNSWLGSPNTTKEDIAERAQKDAEVRKQYLRNNKKQGTSVNNGMGEQLIIDHGDSVQGKSATIDEQMSETGEGKEAHSSDENIDYAAQNGTGEHVIETSATSLSGNAMSEWKPEPLKKGVLEHKQGVRPDDSMSKYYAWMEAAGIKLQNIIDQELGQILRQNPHAKVKFMVVRPENNTTKDGDMKTHLMLVLDYDNKINKGITHIHNEENGGVIESQGKQYLVIGTAGYGSRNADKQVLYDTLFSNNPRSANGYGLVKRGLGEFWKNNPSERFYVHPALETEVVPMSLIPGYIVKQLESDSNPEFRSVRELLADPARNPFGLEMNDLGFGIQELTKFLVVGASLDRVMVPRSVDRNSGSAFVLIPAGNGKMVPSYLKPLFYNEMNDGALKDRVIDLLNGLTAPDYAARLQAVENLSRIFYFDKEGSTILLMKSKPVLSLVRDGKPFKTFTLDSNFDRQVFMEAFSEMNPRVNITKSVLQSNVLLQQYDEAGALQTDIAQLATAGSSYSIYGLDAQGKMIQPEIVNNDIPRAGRNSDFRNGDKTQVVYKHQYYNYDVNEGRYYLNGIPVQDTTLARHLDYNRRIIETGLAPVESKGVWNTYILGSKEHPEAVRVHRNTKEVQEISDVEAVQIIERIEKEKAAAERTEAAKKALEQKSLEDVNLSQEEEGMVVDEETGELITPDELRQRQVERKAQLEEKREKEDKEASTKAPNNSSDKLHRSGAELESSITSTTQNFNTLAKSKQWRRQVRDTIKQKWPDAPSNMIELERFLRDRNVPVDTIGTSIADVEAWLMTIINCR